MEFLALILTPHPPRSRHLDSSRASFFLYTRRREGIRQHVLIQAHTLLGTTTGPDPSLHPGTRPEPTSLPSLLLSPKREIPFPYKLKLQIGSYSLLQFQAFLNSTRRNQNATRMCCFCGKITKLLLRPINYIEARFHCI